MARRPKPFVQDITITGLADKGRGVGRDEKSRVFFIRDTAPGDVVDAQVFRSRKGYFEAFVTEFKQMSPHRVQPFCPHFDHCGGCSMQHIHYERQLIEKQQSVNDAFRRIGHLDQGEVLPIIGNQTTRHYRNKLEFAFSCKRWLTRAEIESGITNECNVLGFHPQKAFDKVLDLQTCFLQEEPSETIRQACVTIGREQGLTFYDVMAHTGFLRQLVIRVFTTGEVLVIVGFGEDDPALRQQYLETLLNRVPSITSLQYFVNTKQNDFFLDLPIIVFNGPEKVEERLGEVRFAIGPKSFFQTNTRQAQRLYDEVRAFADLKGDERVYDLYTGLGSIALYMADGCKEIIGIEEVPAAIEDAKWNASLNGITNASFYAGDVKLVMDAAFIAAHGQPDLLITDPPRAGMHPDVVLAIRKLAPPRILYVSCNPATQARDIQLLGEDYRVVKSRAVDMFPHTHHIENIALLERTP
ncbi:MAG: 23S rRNA (uracil(1939)-C(5))-methyltransferase RlmD [Saprospiraceae bacterium]|nr:23S rRNA (uracil(1939)-C(5))-methyltransferase RlmD [Saprospiraceae bacterium]